MYFSESEPDPDPTRPDLEPKNYGYFTGFKIIDPNRPGSDKTRPGTDPKNYKHLYGSKLSGPKDPGPIRPEPEPDPRTWMPRPTGETCLSSSQQASLLYIVFFITVGSQRLSRSKD